MKNACETLKNNNQIVPFGALFSGIRFLSKYVLRPSKYVLATLLVLMQINI